jgi:hypothetical protein
MKKGSAFLPQTLAATMIYLNSLNFRIRLQMGFCGPLADHNIQNQSMPYGKQVLLCQSTITNTESDFDVLIKIV